MKIDQRKEFERYLAEITSVSGNEEEPVYDEAMEKGNFFIFNMTEKDRARSGNVDLNSFTHALYYILSSMRPSYADCMVCSLEFPYQVSVADPENQGKLKSGEVTFIQSTCKDSMIITELHIDLFDNTMKQYVHFDSIEKTVAIYRRVLVEKRLPDLSDWGDATDAIFPAGGRAEDDDCDGSDGGFGYIIEYDEE
ncbi:MAG: hypothetical protein IKP75_02760 [Oscillospiraceae bacterium]|nr:hypothetical protein [Oscillospiraceae bacterium]